MLVAPSSRRLVARLPRRDLHKVLLPASPHSHRGLQYQYFGLSTAAPPSRKAKVEGDISSVFASLSGDQAIGAQLPQRFADLKASLVSGPDHAAACEYSGT